MKKTIFIIPFLFVHLILVRAQGLELGFQSGIGSYSMSGLKNFNEYAIKRLPFDTKLVSDLPSYYYYKPSLLIKGKFLGFGLQYSYQSTGSRVTGQDYTGKYLFDTKVKSNSSGIYLRSYYRPYRFLELSASTTIGVIFSKLEVKEFFNLLDDEIINEVTKYKARNYYFEPGILLSFPFSYISLGLNLGYTLQFGKQYFYGHSRLYDNKSNEYIKPEWNGIRYGVSILIQIPFTNKTR